MRSRTAVVNTTRRSTILGGAALVGWASSGMLSACGGGGGGAASPAASGSTSTSGSTRAGPSYDGTIAISGNVFVNGSGQPILLRGSTISGYANAMIRNENQGTPDASGGTFNFDQADYPNMSRLAAWKFNCVRIGICEGDWNGTTGYIPGSGVARPGDPKGVYKAQITAVIAKLNAIGCYVNLALCSSSPGTTLPIGQSDMANMDNSIACWKSIAEHYGYPNGSQLKRNGGTVDDRSVIFESYNEPFCDWAHVTNGGFYQNTYDYQGDGGSDGGYLKVYPYPAVISGTFHPNETFTTISGTACSGTVASAWTGTNPHIDLINLSTTALAQGTVIRGNTSLATATTSQPSPGYGWHVAGHNQIIATIRATGAWNPVICAGIDYAQDITEWASYAPSDTTPPSGYNGSGWTAQVGATYHPYPDYAHITAVSVASGGSGYRVGDTILLPMPESGSDAGTVYWQAKLTVTGVSGGAVTGVQIDTYNGGTPGVAGGNATQYGGSIVGGVYAADFLPDSPVPQYSSSGSGSGALFNLTFTKKGKKGSSSYWPTFVALRTTPGVPLFITETGEHTGSGINGSPLMAKMTAWCDANQISFQPYSYNPTPGWYNKSGYDFALAMSDSTPTPGYGKFMWNWFTSHS